MRLFTCSRPPRSPLAVASVPYPSSTPARPHTTAVHLLASCHRTTFVKAISSRRRRTADNHTHGSTSCLSTGLRSPCQGATSPPDRCSPSVPVLKNLLSSCQHIFFFSRASTRCPFHHLCTQTWTKGPTGKVTDATVFQASNQAKAPRTN